MRFRNPIVFAAAAIFLAPTFAQGQNSGTGSGTFSLIEPTLLLEVFDELEFGPIIRPSIGGGNLTMTCGADGTPTVSVPGLGGGDASASDNQCAKIEISSATVGQNLIITFSAGGKAFTDSNNNALDTTFTLYESGVAVSGLSGFNPAGDSPANSGSLLFNTGSSIYYLGATAAISSTTPTDDYDAELEISVAVDGG